MVRNVGITGKKRFNLSVISLVTLLAILINCGNVNAIGIRCLVYKYSSDAVYDGIVHGHGELIPGDLYGWYGWTVNLDIPVLYGTDDVYVIMNVVSSDSDKNLINSLNPLSSYDDSKIFATIFPKYYSAGSTISYDPTLEVKEFDNLDAGTTDYTPYMLIRPEEGLTYTESMTFEPTFTEKPYVCDGTFCVATAVTPRFRFNVSSPVPEPSTILLMGIGLLGLVSIKSRKKKS